MDVDHDALTTRLPDLRQNSNENSSDVGFISNGPHRPQHNLEPELELDSTSEQVSSILIRLQLFETPASSDLLKPSALRLLERQHKRADNPLSLRFGSIEPRSSFRILQSGKKLRYETAVFALSKKCLNENPDAVKLPSLGYTDVVNGCGINFLKVFQLLGRPKVL